jgi:hypothetical protein
MLGNGSAGLVSFWLLRSAAVLVVAALDSSRTPMLLADAEDYRHIKVSHLSFFVGVWTASPLTISRN